MAWKKKRKPLNKGTPEYHRRNIAMVAGRYPDFSTTTRWALEVAFIDAAYLYEDGQDSGMPDHVWDALGDYLAKTWKKRSAFFQHGVDRATLRKKATALAINFGAGIGAAAANFWAAEAEPALPAPKPRKLVKKKPRRLKKKPTRRLAVKRKPS